jgi:hypothetical protein
MLNKVLIPLNEIGDGNQDKLLISGWKKEETVIHGLNNEGNSGRIEADHEWCYRIIYR